MDDFNLRDLLMPPLRYRADLPSERPQVCPAPPAGHPPVPDGCPGVLAMASVPSQRWEGLYEAEQGLHRGTIFRALDLPFEGGGDR